ncbi:MAG: sigma-70 family RNA polymerase sigma factor [Clostridia bacterium]|nr:sigma-70 family RNA polymerase sigma factor [Clostridia bacterium]
MNRDITERNRLVSENMGLVHACANRFRGRGVDYEDLVQSGCIGLLKAAEGFDESRGFMFSTYAVPAIIGEIKRIFRDGGTVKVGRSDKEKARNLLALRDEMTTELGREPSISELAQKAGYEVAETSQLLCASMPVLSLTVDDESGECSEIDVTTGDTTEEMGDSIALKAAVENLSDRDRKIVEFRYFSGLTQTVTAKKLGMTQVQVSRREKVILQELRKKLG